MSVTLDDISLPEEMIWLDEAKWNRVAQSTGYALSGSLLVQSGTKLQGRTMTIGGDNCWASWALCKQLLSLADEAGKEMTITLEDGRAFKVIWNYEDGDPVDATRIYERQPQDEDWCRLTLRFLIIGEA